MKLKLTKSSLDGLKALATSKQVSATELATSVLEGYIQQQQQLQNSLDLPIDPEDQLDLLQSLREKITKKVKKYGVGERTGVERIVLSTMALHEEVNNGGFRQFFDNSSAEHAETVVMDLEIIGARKVAAIARMALRSRSRRSSAIPDERELAVYQRCDATFYETPELIPKLWDYVRRHPGGIRLKSWTPF